MTRDIAVKRSAPTVGEAEWTSPWWEPGFEASEVIPSWEATTPLGTWIEVELRGRRANGSQTDWFTLARWCSQSPDEGAPLARSSAHVRPRDGISVEGDTLTLGEEHPVALQARIRSCALEGVQKSATLGRVCIMASALPETVPPTSVFTLQEEVRIDVAPLSQRVLLDLYPHWDKGGQHWCSPTSTTMVLQHWNKGPAGDELTWVDAPAQPEVVQAARGCFDHGLEACGNWAFNTAWAAQYDVHAFVTRLRGLDEAERFIAVGIPLVMSIRFETDELDGAGYRTNGHLVVLKGFTQSGDVIVNDPNAHKTAFVENVETVFRRDQFEACWMRGSGGAIYVIHPDEVDLPAAPQQANW